MDLDKLLQPITHEDLMKRRDEKIDACVVFAIEKGMPEKSASKYRQVLIILSAERKTNQLDFDWIFRDETYARDLYKTMEAAEKFPLFLLCLKSVRRHRQRAKQIRLAIARKHEVQAMPEGEAVCEEQQ